MKITKTDVIRTKIFREFDFFTRYFFKELNGRKFVLGEHHKILFDAVERVMNGEVKRLIVNLPPRYSKTEIVVKNFVSYSLARNPKAKFIHLTYADQLALDNSEDIRDIINSAEYQELFPYVQIKKDSKAKNKWYTTEGGGMLARSASGQVTGFGAGAVDEEEDDLNEFTDEGDEKEFGGAIIIDDPIKPDDAESDLIREKVNRKFDTTIRNRVNSRNTPIIVIMQRLHENDLCGYLMENEGEEWEVISLPVIDDQGGALWSFKHTIEELRELEEINEHVFQTQYMQNPTPMEGLLFKKDELNYFDADSLDVEQYEYVSAFVDIADTGDDWHCAIVGINVGEKIYIVDVVFTKKSVEENVKMTAELINRFKPEYCTVEVNMGGTMYPMLLKKELKDTRVLPHRERSNKKTRIYSISGQVKKYCYFCNDYQDKEGYRQFMKNLFEYRKDGSSKHDDAPDALAGLVTYISKRLNHLY